MTIKKRLLSLTLAVLLITALAIPASAAKLRHDNNITYDGCNFNTYAILNSNTLQNIIELTFCPASNDYNDYLLHTSVTYHVYDNEGYIVYGYYRESNPATRISSFLWASTNRYYSSLNTYYVNINVVDSAYLSVE